MNTDNVNYNLEHYMERMEVLAKRDSIMESNKWIREIPYIKFKPEWEVKVIPPHAGAVVRFLVKHPDTKTIISVYLDCYDIMGSMGQPYWEMYPYKGDIERFFLNEVDQLVDAIEISFHDLIEQERMNPVQEVENILDDITRIEQNGTEEEEG